MDPTDILAEILKGMTPLLRMMVWSLARSAINGRPSSPSSAHGRMADTREIAGSVGGWSAPAAGRRGGSLPPAPSPRSDPMWDRELDG